MTWILTTSGAALAKAGVNRSSGVSGSMLATFNDQAEMKICAETRRDWILLSGSTLTNFKGILDDAASSDMAIKIINYDMSGYTSRTEAQTMLDVNRDIYLRCIEVLKDEKNKEKMTS